VYRDVGTFYGAFTVMAYIHLILNWKYWGGWWDLKQPQGSVFV